MKEKPTVSVIMSEYNTDEDTLEKSIQSVLDQSFTDFEFIIIDDCGQTDVAQFVRRFADERIKVVKNPRNLGLAASLNHAVKVAQGQYLIRMDSDDLSLDGRFARLVDVIEQHPEYAVVSSRVLEVADGQESGVLGTPGEKKTANVLAGDVPVHAAAIMNRQAILTVGGYPEIDRAEDFGLWCELLLQGYQLYMIADILYVYNVNRADYQKRTLKYRRGEIAARRYYNRLLGGGWTGQLRIAKSLLAGILPGGVMQKYRELFVLKKK